MKNQGGFTLIELLVVVGILAILAIAALIAINPLEAQRRARDSTRLVDMARLSAVMETYMNDEGIAAFTAAGKDDVNTQGALKTRSQSCSSNWIGVDLCIYLKQVPVDPQNTRSISAISFDTSGAKSRIQATAGYGFHIDTVTGNYIMCTYLEAEKNYEILKSDGGLVDSLFETGNDLTLTCSPS